MWRALAAAAALGSLAAGCGSDDGARKAVVAAAEKTTQGGPLAFEQSVAITPGRPEHGRIRSSGSVDGRTRTGLANLSTSMTGEPPLSETAREFDDLDGQVAQRGEIVFLRLPSLARELGRRVHWVRFAPDDAAARRNGVAGTSNFGTLELARPVDPLRAAEEVERQETRGGVTHYKLRVDFKRYVGMVSAPARKALEPQLRKLVRGTGTTSFPAEAWIDEDGRVTRFRLRLLDRIGRVIFDSRMDLKPAADRPVVPTRAVPFHKLADK